MSHFRNLVPILGSSDRIPTSAQGRSVNSRALRDHSVLLTVVDETPKPPLKITKAPDSPKTTKSSAITCTPHTTDIPNIQSIPHIVCGPHICSIPNVSCAPPITSIPSIPIVSGISSIPSIPNITGIPNIPNIPCVSAVPPVPTVSCIPPLNTELVPASIEMNNNFHMAQFMGAPIPTVNPALVQSNAVVQDGTTIQESVVRDITADDGFSPIRMNRFNIFSQKDIKRIASNSGFWHKIIILRGAGYSKVEIMRAFFDQIHPHLTGPCMFRREGSAVTFLVKNCLPCLLSLFNEKKQTLQVTFNGPHGLDVHYLDIEIVFRHCLVKDLRIYLFEYFSAALSKRYDKSLGILDLSAFHEDPDISHVVFWPLWVPKAFSSLINVIKRRPQLAVRYLNLSNNELVDIPKLNFVKKLDVLDLSSNKLSHVPTLGSLASLEIGDLILDMNPLCASFGDEITYIRAIKEVVPNVRKIDGVYVSRPSLPPWRQHFVLLGQPDCVALVDQFLQHFFTLLDGDDRQRLRGMYHPEAMFSLTCNYLPGQSTSSTARLTRYTLESRNLLKMSDYSKSQQLLSHGAEEVLSALSRLPRTEHDPYSFAVDLPYYTQDTAMIVVSGVFREPSMTNEKLIRAFSRTFILRKVASKEYQIVNEMLTVSNASTKQAEDSFKFPKSKVSLAKLSFNPAQDLTDSDRLQMTKILSRLTEMNQHWSQKCLEESKWDIKQALMVFTEMLKMNKLPGEAFDLEDEKSGDRK